MLSLNMLGVQYIICSIYMYEHLHYIAISLKTKPKLYISAEAHYRKVCYYTNWAQYRPGKAKFVPENIPTHLCTHLVYAFATMEGNRLKAFEWNDDGEYGMQGM